MRKFTLIATALLMMSGAAVAQKSFKHSAFKAKAAAGVKPQGTAVKAGMRKAPASLYMPLHEEEWWHDGEDWTKNGETFYTYDTKGNVLTSRYVTEEEVIETTNVYDADNQKIEKTEKTYAEGVDAMSGNRLTYVYDAVVKGHIVESMEYEMDGDSWNLVGLGRTWKRELTRDSEGRVTGLVVKTYFMGEFADTRRVTITYGEDGKAATWKYEELTYDGENMAWEEYYTLTDMEWHETDGQIVAEDIRSFFTGNNRLSKARVIEPGYGETGTITATYAENGNYRYSFNYAEPLSRDVTTVTFTDENGSVTEETAYYEDMNEDGVITEDELMEGGRYVMVCDSHGELISESEYFGDELMGGSRYDVFYGEYDYPVEWIAYEYDIELEDYTPFLMVVRDSFIDVTQPASIAGVTSSSENGVSGVYNMQGVRVGDGAEALPAGLYIVKKDGRTTKIVRK